MTSFRFAIVRPGFEAWLKAEWAREAPALRASFQRPGLVTFRCDALDAPRVPSVFARVQGTSVGFAKDDDAIRALLRALPRAPTRLHVFPRTAAEIGSRGDEGPVPAPLPAEVLRLRSMFATECFGDEGISDVAVVGDLVLDLAVAADEPTMVGVHVHGPSDSPHPGGDPRTVLPPAAPSRAYLKLEEALAFSGETIGPSDVVVEAGCAPGGASLAMLRRGARVTGIDPGDVAAVLGTYGDRFSHLAMPVGAVTREMLPRRATVLVCDVHLAPAIAIRAMRRLVAMFRPTLRLFVMTLKLNDRRVADDIPRLIEQLRALGPRSLVATQLPANRQEITVVLRFADLAGLENRL